MMKYCFGVDIGGTSIKMGFFNQDGELLEKWSIPTNLEQNGKYILKEISVSLDGIINDKMIDKSSIIGIGIGVPGPIRGDGVVQKCVNLGWNVIDVKKEFTELTSFNVRVGNDANVAALGEMYQGSAKGYNNLIMVTMGTGIGAGIIVNGKILNGAHGAGGEIGHIKMSDSEIKICGCGNHGCLEQYASATGIVNTTKKAIESEKISEILISITNGGQLTAEKIFTAATAGDLLSLRMVNTVGEMLGKALAQLSCIVDPEVFVIGGGMANAGDILMNSIKKYYLENVFHAAKETKIIFASLGNDAGIFGGAKLILE